MPRTNENQQSDAQIIADAIAKTGRVLGTSVEDGFTVLARTLDSTLKFNVGPAIAAGIERGLGAISGAIVSAIAPIGANIALAGGAKEMVAWAQSGPNKDRLVRIALDQIPLVALRPPEGA